MYIGFDTSNYTTSVALFDGENVIQQKRLLNVKAGERGVRQSDAVFQHTVNMPDLLTELNYNGELIKAVGASIRPRNIDGSYMPCFLVGKNTAYSVSKFCGAKLYETSHQVGHILAALYSANQLELIDSPFIAFHLSGGTTEALLVTPDKHNIINAQIIAQSSDLKAGQAIDRTGVMLGMNFPCGKELDELSKQSDMQFKHKLSFNGLDCSLSGVENKVKSLIETGMDKCNIAKFVITYICEVVDKMTQMIIEKYGNLPLIYAGGVMSNSYIKKIITDKYNAFFAAPEFSCDNACGVAVYAYLKDNKLL